MKKRTIGNIVVIALLMMAVVPSSFSTTQDDMIVYRPSNANWYMHETEPAPNYLTSAGAGLGAAGIDSSAQWGLANDAPLVGDVDGDGVDDVVVTRAAAGGGNYSWYAGHTDAAGQIGSQGYPSPDSSVSGFGTSAGNIGNFLSDTTGNGADDAVTVNSGFYWHRVESNVGTGMGGAYSGNIQFGNAAVFHDQAVMGDFNGDGLVDKGLFRDNGNGFASWLSDFSLPTAFGNGTIDGNNPFGLSTDIPLVGDINGDGFDDGLVLRPNVGNPALFDWYVGYTDAAGNVGGAGSTSTLGFGLVGDIPLIADIDGDGKDDLVVQRGTQYFASFTNPDGTMGDNAVESSASFVGSAGDIAMFGQYSIPEPASIIMLMVGGGVLWFRKRFMI